MRHKYLIGLIPFAALIYCVVWVVNLLESVAASLPK